MSVLNPRLEALVRSLRPCAVAVIGDVMLDRYVRGQVRRLSPEAPIQVLEVADDERMPGGAANVAMKAVGLGSTVRMVGLIGEDASAAELRALLATQPGLTDALLSDPSRATTEKSRFIAHNQQLLRVDRERRVEPNEGVRERLAELAYEAAASSDAVILEDYGKGVLCAEVVRAALEGARKSGARRRRRPQRAELPPLRRCDGPDAEPSRDRDRRRTSHHRSRRPGGGGRRAGRTDRGRAGGHARERGHLSVPAIGLRPAQACPCPDRAGRSLRRDRCRRCRGG